ncbi:MAG: hypothetical protein ABL907_18975, partial [Hyphomicrobium sp.]
MNYTHRLLQCLVLMVGLVALSGTVNAACSSPAGNAGAIRYASNYNTLAFCNGTDWVSMAGWNNSSGGGASLLNELGDVDTSGASDGQALVYSSGNWIPGTAQDARIGTITDTKWCVGSGTSIVCNTDAPLLATAVLNDLADVDTTGVATGKTLAYDGTNWVVSDSAVASTALGDRITSGTTNVIATQDRSVTISTAGSQRVVVGENGNVGIGTSSPATGLDIRNGYVIVSSSVAGFAFRDRSVGSHLGMWYRENGAISLYDSELTGSRMTINTATGNVGISTTTASATLTVNGSAIISGTVQVAGAANETCTPGKLGTIRFNPVVIPPFLTGFVGRTHTAVCSLSFWSS